jgi:hypothetical protein
MTCQPGTGTCWTNNERDEGPGSAFHEIMVLPTFLPGLARPEYQNPNSQFIPIPQPRSQQNRNSVLGVVAGAAGSAALGVDEDNNGSIHNDQEQLPGTHFNIYT